METLPTQEVQSLNDVLYDADLSIEELEERLEFAEPWICVIYNNSCSPVVRGV